MPGGAVNTYRIYAEIKRGTDGVRYSVQYWLTPAERDALQAAELIGDVSEVVGMAEAAEIAGAYLEKEIAAACGLMQ